MESAVEAPVKGGSTGNEGSFLSQAAPCGAALAKAVF